MELVELVELVELDDAPIADGAAVEVGAIDEGDPDDMDASVGEPPVDDEPTTGVVPTLD